MTHEQFTFWLEGYLDGISDIEDDAVQTIVTKIQEKIDLIGTKDEPKQDDPQKNLEDFIDEFNRKSKTKTKPYGPYFDPVKYPTPYNPTPIWYDKTHPILKEDSQ